jgi:cell division protein FtsI (penicillin-binding protein 3)
MSQLKSPLHNGRFFALAAGLFFFWFVLEANLFRFQVVDHERLTSVAKKQYEREITLEAQRGTIYDRSGNKMATNIIYYDIAADPLRVKNKEYIATTLSNAFPKPRNYYLNKMNRNSNFSYLERRTTEASVRPLLNFQDPGLIRFENFGRYYPYGSYAAQLIGFTDPDDKGLSGLELQYENQLQGKNGKAILQYDATRGVSFNADYPLLKPVAGMDYYLTLDKDIQTVVEKALKNGVDKIQAKSGMVIVMDPSNGAILAMANYPSFNPNKHKNYQEWVKKNRTITDSFEPGSTMKMFSASAILQERLKKPDDIVFCENGKYKLYDHTINDTKNHAWLSFQKVVELSSNIGMVKLVEEMPKNTLFRYLKNYGFGTETDIGLLGESPGSLAPPAKWSGLSKAMIAIGQEIGVTALQITTAFCTLLNGGYLYKPFIISHCQEYGSDEWTLVNKPQKIRQVISPEVCDILKEFMKGVVERGTGKNARVDQIIVGGKTGTAQKFNRTTDRYYSSKYVSSFIGFAPFEEPKYVCAVFIDEPLTDKYGGEAAAPIFSEIISQIVHFGYKPPVTPEQQIENRIYTQKVKSIPPLEGFEIEPVVDYLDEKDFDVEINGQGRFIKNASVKDEKVVINPQDNQVKMDNMPDLRGMTLRQALNHVDFSKLSVRISGSGKIYDQSIKGGTQLKNKKQVLLSLK